MKKTLLAFCMSVVSLTLVSHIQAQTLSSSPTISFSNSTGFADNIAQDGEGGSVNISDFNIQVIPINSSGVKLVSYPLQYHDGADWGGYPALITYGDIDPHFGWSIRSDNGLEFKLMSLDFLDWGEFSGALFTAQAFRNGTSLGSVNFSGNTTATMVHLANGGNLTSIFNDVDEVRIYKQDGMDAWTGLNSIRVSSLSVLPVSLNRFTATQRRQDVLLEWTTLSEQNSRDFVLQRSGGDGQWSDLATISASMNSNIQREYSFLDTHPLEGTNYYRLLQRDMSGSTSYSEVVAIELKASSGQLAVFPNPVVNGRLEVSLKIPALITVYNACGVLVIQKHMEAGTHTLLLNNLAKGLYHIRAGSSTASFVLQ